MQGAQRVPSSADARPISQAAGLACFFKWEGTNHKRKVNGTSLDRLVQSPNVIGLFFGALELDKMLLPDKQAGRMC